MCSGDMNSKSTTSRPAGAQFAL